MSSVFIFALQVVKYQFLVLQRLMLLFFYLSCNKKEKEERKKEKEKTKTIASSKNKKRREKRKKRVFRHLYTLIQLVPIMQKEVKENKEEGMDKKSNIKLFLVKIKIKSERVKREKNGRKIHQQIYISALIIIIKKEEEM
uniref:Uncharacterized protein n=1 Tax=Micrurus lemniscatus lemniscatus TaxID=129467 RepID=A0A2D4HQV9_MICLE